MDNFTEIGHAILSGKKIEHIALNGREFHFNYTYDEFVETAIKSGWPEDIAHKYAQEYEDKKIDGFSVQSRYISDFTSDYCLNSGGYGCVHGDTLIYDAETGRQIAIRELYEERRAIKVLSLEEGKIVRAQATVPVKYEKAQLYEVRTATSRFVTTAKHRFLTPQGWKRLSDLSVGERLVGYAPSPQDSIEDSAQSVRALGVLRWIEKALGSLSYCLLELRSCGGRLLGVLNISPNLTPSPTDALGHTPYDHGRDDRSSSLKRTHACLKSSLLSKNDSFPSEKRRLALGEAGYILGGASAHISERVLSSWQALWNFVSRQPAEIGGLDSLSSSYPYPTIVSITPYAVDNYYDLHVFGTHNYLAEGVFHHNSGKSIALYIKLILMVKCFPGNRVLLGRKTLSDIDRAVLPELFELMPRNWYEHRVKDGLINIDNGSQIVLFGLDAMQSGSIADIKKAQQKLKSLNLGAYFIDQLEEVEMPVIEVLNSRLRRKEVPFRQGNSDCNPANFWAYHQFKKKQKQIDNEWIDDPESNSTLYESSMLQNPNLPWDYIRKQLSLDDAYVRRFVKGEWSTDILIKGTVFAKENIMALETMVKAPLSIREGCQIYENPVPGEIYQIGVDPSEGVVDPSSISVVSGSGKKVAKFNGYITIPELADKIKFLYYLYNKPLIIPEVNKSSILEHIKDLRIYKRRQQDYREKKETEKLGFITSWSSKEALITHFQQLLRRGVPKIYDSATIEEMKSFTWTNEASQQGASASRGFHDDDVMSTLLAFWDLSPQRTEELKVAKSLPHHKKRFQWA